MAVYLRKKIVIAFVYFFMSQINVQCYYHVHQIKCWKMKILPSHLIAFPSECNTFHLLQHLAFCLGLDPVVVS
jgi:hypothetical protein